MRLGDVDDIEGFCTGLVHRMIEGTAFGGKPGKPTLGERDFEEARGEALVLAYELWYGRPRCAECRESLPCEHGYLYAHFEDAFDTTRGPFSRYLLYLLPRRLVSWQRRYLRQEGRARLSRKAGGLVPIITVPLEDRHLAQR